VRAMHDDDETRQHLRLIQGPADAEHQPGRVIMRVCRARTSPTLSVDAVVLEEDTWLTVSAPPELRVPTEPLIRLMTELLTWKPKEPGSVIVRRGRPTRLLAVVYDFSQEPTSRAEWVAAALDRILHPPTTRPLRKISLPLLGTHHGGLELGIFLALLRQACERANDTAVSELHLRLDKGVSPDLLRALDHPVGER
jgi:hypothetical protein